MFNDWKCICSRVYCLASYDHLRFNFANFSDAGYNDGFWHTYMIDIYDNYNW